MSYTTPVPYLYRLKVCMYTVYTEGMLVVEVMLQVQSTYQMHGWMDVSYIH